MWENRRLTDDALDTYRISDHPTGSGRLIRTCRTPTTRAEGDIVTAAVIPGNALKLKAFRIGDRPTIQIDHGQ